MTESARSQRSIEAEILAGQAEDSEYAKANLANHEAQDELKTAQEEALTNEEFQTKRAALLKEEDHGLKIAQLQRETLGNDLAYQKALDKSKAAKLTLQHIKSGLFKENTEWVDAAHAAKERAADETKANNEATRGAFHRMPAVRNLREANAAADKARAVIAQAENVLRSLNAPIPPQPGQTGKPAGKTSKN